MSIDLRKVLSVGALAVVAGFTGVSAHDSVNVTVGGDVDVRFAFVDQDSAFERVNPTSTTGAKLKDNGVLTDAGLDFNVEGHNAHLKYGGKVRLNANTSAAKNSNSFTAEEAYIYVDTPYARAEMGSTAGVTHKMKVGGENVAVGNGGIMGDSRYLWNERTYKRNTTDTDEYGLVDNHFITSPSLPMDERNRENGSVREGNKISLMSPHYYGLSLGLSYQSDSQLSGTSNKFSELQQDLDSNDVFFDVQYKNIVSTALHYQGEMSGVGYKFGLAGQFGKSKDTKFSSDTSITNIFGGSYKTYERKNLSAYQVGLELSYMGVQFGGSYVDLGKSGQFRRAVKADGTVANVKGRRSYAWNLGLGYKMGDFGASVTYMESERSMERLSSDDTGVQRNKFSNLVFDVEYVAAPGLMPYAQVAFFDFKDRHAKKADNDSKSNDGTVFMVGTKLQF